jgi:hypothetical protein
MIASRLPRNNFDFSTIAPTFFYLYPSIAVACRAIKLGDASSFTQQIYRTIGEHTCEGKENRIGLADNCFGGSVNTFQPLKFMKRIFLRCVFSNVLILCLFYWFVTMDVSLSSF